MAQYHVPDAEDYLECPYERTHMVRAKRFQYHLMKCRNNYKGREYMTCPFNAKHEMPKPEYRHHLQHCPDKALIEPERQYQARLEEGNDSTLKGYTAIPAHSDMVVPQTESWDEEAEGTARVGVDPAHFSSVRFLNIGGLSSGQKKKMRQAGNLSNEEKIKNLMQDMQINDTEDGGSLRLPKSSSYAAMANQPQIKPREQPTSAVFAYSVGRGRGRGGMTHSNSAPVMNGVPSNGVMANGTANGHQNGRDSPTDENPDIIYRRDSNPDPKPAPGPPPQASIGRGRGRGTVGVGRGIGMNFVPPPPGFGGLGRAGAWGSADPAFPQFIVPKLGSSNSSVMPNVGADPWSTN